MLLVPSPATAVIRDRFDAERLGFFLKN